MLILEKSASEAPICIPKQQQDLEIEKFKQNFATKVINAKAKMASLAIEESTAILEVVRESMEEIIAQLPEQQTEINQIFTTVIEELVRGIIVPKRSAIAELQKQIQILQAKREEEQNKLQSQIHSILNAVENAGKTESVSIRTAIEFASKAMEEKKESNFYA